NRKSHETARRSVALIDERPGVASKFGLISAFPATPRHSENKFFSALGLHVNYHLSILEVAANIGKFSYFIDPFSSSACRFEVDSPSLIFNGRGIRLPHFVFSGHLASQAV
ncbi:MAG: hypothetical protein J6Q35_00055, partial [Rikenellaceae bacterium]|nr:hypothetical protein [Rikenellaceae bacterium]